MVTVHKIGEGGWDRPLVFIYVDGVNVNAEMIRQGLAWHFLKYSKSDAFDELESEAREAKRGLWADADPTAPWAWRKSRRAEIEAKAF